MASNSLRGYTEVHSGETLPDLRGRFFRNALFSDCVLGKVRGATFQDCVFQCTRLEARDLRDLFGTTLTLDCFTFEGIEFSPEALDGVLYLLSISKGNEAQRERIRRVIDPARLRLFQRMFPETE